MIGRQTFYISACDGTDVLTRQYKEMPMPKDHVPGFASAVPIEIPRFEMPVIKSPPEYAYDSLMNGVLSFQRRLDADTEIGIVASGAATILHVERISFNGQIFTFHGVDAEGRSSCVLQHFTQINIQMIAVPKTEEQPRRIGF